MLAMAEPGDEHVAPLGEPYARQRRAGGGAQRILAARRTPEMKGMTGMCLHGKRNIVEDGKIRKQRGDLERAGEAELAAPIGGQRGDVVAAEMDAADVGRELSGQLADQRALARAVRPDDGMKLAGGYQERNIVRRDDTAEAFAQVLDMQQGLSHGVRPKACRRSHRVRTTRRAGRSDR